MCESYEWAGGDCVNKDPSAILEKLDSLLKDEIANKIVYRQCKLITDYVRLSPNGIRMKDLKYVMSTLEYLGEHLDDIPDYKEPLSSLLKLCLSPPLLERSSEGFLSIRVLQEFFTVLGYMIVCLHDGDLQFLVLDIIKTQIIRDGPTDLTCVKLDLCHLAMERSLLAQTVGEILALVSWSIYPQVLELAFLICSISITCCHQMICAGAIDAILMKLDPDYHSQFNQGDSTKLETYKQKDEAFSFSVALNILWALLRSIDQVNNPPHEFPVPTLASLKSIHHQLRKETYQKNTLRRNDLLGILVLMMRVYPKLPLVPSGVVEDLAMLSVATEMGTENTWAVNITFEPTQENLIFKKLLILSNCFTIQYRAVREVFKSTKVIQGLINLVTPVETLMTCTWRQKQKWELVSLNLRAMTIIIPELAETFIENNGHRMILIQIQEYVRDPYSEEVILNGMKILVSITVLNNKYLLESLHHLNAMYYLLLFCNYILVVPDLTQIMQKLLTRTLFVMEVMTRNQPTSQNTYGLNSVAVVISCFNRILKPKEFDSLIDDRLMICLIDFLWECIIWNAENMKAFVQKGGTYLLLDIIEKYNYPVKLISLAALVDLVEQRICLTHLLTWRGQEQEDFSHMLLNIWRNEEAYHSVRRSEMGCLSDIELPLMGTEQYILTFQDKDPSSSPAILDLLASSRPNIYAIFQIIHQRYEEDTKLIQETYHVNLGSPSTEDKITLKIVENFLALKIGEVWVEVAQDLQNLHLQPLPLDNEVLEALLTHQRNWSICVQDAQFRIQFEAYKKELEQEDELYSKIRESHIHDALDALRELDYIARTTDRAFLLQRKQQQIKQVNDSLHFPTGIDTLLTHRTFPADINVTAICKQKVTVCSMQEAKFEEDQIEQVSVNNVTLMDSSSDQELVEFTSYHCM